MTVLTKALAAALLFLCCVAWASAAQPAEKSRVKFELRRAESKPAEGLTEATVAGTKDKVYLHKEAALTNQDIAQAQADNAREILRREWLITNGIGGYGSGTISGMVSRRYHGLLIAALPAPYGRVVMLNHLSEYLRIEGSCILVGGEEPSSAGEKPEPHFVREFRLEEGLPIWVYEAAGYLIEKQFKGPPSMVTFLPAFWLLVPGSVGLISVAHMLSDRDAGIEGLVNALFAFASIALGTLVGASIYRWTTESLGAWRLQAGRAAPTPKKKD